MSENVSRTMMATVVVIVVVFAGLLLLGSQSFGMMGGGMMGGAMGLGTLLFIALLVWLALTAADRQEPQRQTYPPYPGPGGEFPLQVLDRKYSNGEMTYEEYITLREEILRR
jgi:uncharacterized membrane protein